MARSARSFLPNIPLHVIQRGNNKSNCFNTDDDRAAYLAKLHEFSQRLEVAIHCFVLMTNHVHLLLTPGTADGASRLMHLLGTWYVRYFNQRYQRTGTLWEGRFRASIVQSDQYFYTVSRYIELNPVRAGMVKHPADYHWSSYHGNAMGYDIKLLTPHSLYLALGSTRESQRAAYRRLFETPVTDAQLRDIRQATKRSGILQDPELALAKLGSG